MYMQTTRRCIIQIDMQYPELFTEIVLDDTISTEVALESELGPLLAELFGGTVLIDDVKVCYPTSHTEEDR
jgi:hypothetical protein